MPLHKFMWASDDQRFHKWRLFQRFYRAHSKRVALLLTVFAFTSIIGFQVTKDTGRCKNIFIDGGSNWGDNIASFAKFVPNETYDFTDHQNEVSRILAKVLKNHPTLNAKSFCAFGFEGNNFKRF